MPQIPLRTAQSDATSPRSSSPQIGPNAFGFSAAVGEAGLGRSVEQLSGAVAGVALNLKKQQEIDAHIAEQKMLQESRYRVAQGKILLKQAADEAQNEIPSDAELQPGQAPQSSLLEAFQKKAREKTKDLGSGLYGPALEHFQQFFNADMTLAELAVKRAQRGRDVDAGRASLEKSEQAYRAVAADPTENIDLTIRRYHADVDAAVKSGFWDKYQGETIKNATEKEFRSLHEAATKNEMIDRSVEFYMGLEIPESQRIKMAREQVDEKIRPNVIRGIQQRSQYEARILKEQNDKAFDEMALRIERDGLTADEVGASSLPPEYERTLRHIEGQVAGAIARRDSEIARQFDKQAKVDNWNRLWDLRDKDAEAFKKVNLRREKMNLPEGTYESLVQEQDALNGGKPSNKLPSTLSRSLVGARSMIERAYPDDEQMQGWAFFRLQEVYEARLEHDQKPMSVKEQREMAAEVLRPMLKGDYKGFSPLSNWLIPKYDIPILEITPKEAKRIVETPAVDQDERWRSLAIDLLQRRGIPLDKITPSDIEDTIFNFLDENGLLEDSDFGPSPRGR